MRIRKTLYILIGMAVVIQACGAENPAPASPPPATETQPSASEAAPTGAMAPTIPEGEFFVPIPFRAGLAYRGNWLEVYFIDPTSAFAKREVGSVDAIVAAAIIAANQSVDVALRTLTLDTITNALITAHRRGIPVRVVAESDNLNSASDRFQFLISAGIPVVDDKQKGLLNGSFIVIDGNQVWTGSVDYDVAGVFRKYNTVLRISSAEIGADYAKEFEEMFVNQQFGQLIAPETPYPVVDIQGTSVEVLFSPDDFVSAHLAQLLGGAQESIQFMAYAFALTELGSAIRTKAAEGVQVAGVLESDLVSREQPNPAQLEEWNLFQKAGLDVRLDGKSEVMNHKIMIIDHRIVVVGSYDFTSRAENDNDENVLIFHNELIAEKFAEEFQRIQTRAQE